MESSDKVKKNFRNYFFSTYRIITVGGFVNQLIKKFWPYQTNAGKILDKSNLNHSVITFGIHWIQRIGLSGFIQASMSKIQGLLKATPTAFKDLKLMKNTYLSVKILLQKC